MMRSAPTGLVTLVFTDVQASTALWDRAPRVMKRALLLHDQILRAAIERFNGYEVKTEGDAFMVAFHDPVDATRWCLETQTALNEADWPSELETEEAAVALYGAAKGLGFRGLRVRMGIHQGQPECRENSRGDVDYFGSDVNRAARLCDAGHGGQVLLSASVWRAVEGAGIGHAVDLGEFVLRGFHEPELIVQMLPDALSGRQFPPLRGVEEAMPEWSDAAEGSSEKEAPWREASVVGGRDSVRLALYCGDQFPIEAVRRLAVKHDLQLVRLRELDSVQPDDVLVVDGGQEAEATLRALRDLRPVWRHCYWVSFHEPSPPMAGVDRLSPMDVAIALEEALFGADESAAVVLEEPSEDPPWLEEHRPDPPGFRLNKSAVAVVLIWATIPAFYFMTAEPALDVELPTVMGDGTVGGTGSMSPSEATGRAKAGTDRSGGRPGLVKGVKAPETDDRSGRASAAANRGKAKATVAQRSPVTLFRTAYCPACRGVACLLDRHEIPYKALDLDEDDGAQAAFPKSLIEPSGAITVPLLRVGVRSIQGYKHNEITKALDQAGYVIEPPRAARGRVAVPTTCKTFKKKELENWTRPRFSVLSPLVTSEKKRRAKQPMPFDVGPMSACLKKLSKKGKKRLARAKKLSVTLRMGIMGDGRIVAVSVEKMVFGSRRYKRRKVSSCIEGAVVGQTYPLRPKREPEFLTKTYRIP